MHAQFSIKKSKSGTTIRAAHLTSAKDVIIGRSSAIIRVADKRHNTVVGPHFLKAVVPKRGQAHTHDVTNSPQAVRFLLRTPWHYVSNNLLTITRGFAARLLFRFLPYFYLSACENIKLCFCTHSKYIRRKGRIFVMARLCHSNDFGSL
jgi:hypothetical protein